MSTLKQFTTLKKADKPDTSTSDKSTNVSDDYMAWEIEINTTGL